MNARGIIRIPVMAITLIAVTVAAPPLVHSQMGRLHRIETITFEGEDGFSLAGTYYSSTSAAPAVLMIQQCGASQSRWTYENLAMDVARSGLHVLTFDFRGSFDSNDPDDERSAALELIPGDIERGFQYLSSRDSVTDVRVVLGASCGAGLAAEVAKTHPEVRGVGMLSSNTGDPVIVDYLVANQISVFGAGAKDDELMYRDKATGEFVRSNAADWLESTGVLWEIPGSRLITFETAAHGMELLVDNWAFTNELAGWIHETSGI